MMYAILLFALFQFGTNVSETVRIDADHTLLLIGGRRVSNPRMGEDGANLVYVPSWERLKLAVSGKSGPVWELADASVEVGELYARVARVDNRSVVIERKAWDYAVAEKSLKLFFDLTSRRVLKTIAFDPAVSVVSLRSAEDRVCATVVAGETTFASCGDEDHQTIVTQFGSVGSLPEHVLDPLSPSYRSPLPEPLPQSAYDQFAKARPGRVRDGYSQDVTEIRERVGGYEVAGDRIWFGKSFYDGEGTTGVGGIGYYDTKTRRFSMLDIPQLADWSVSALLVEDDAIWIGRVAYLEDAARSGGLIRYDLSTRRVTEYTIPDIPWTMLRRNDALFTGTSNGLYVFRGGRFTRFRFEPNLDGGFEPVREPLP
jgi:hypothetical protein